MVYYLAFIFPQNISLCAKQIFDRKITMNETYIPEPEFEEQGTPQ